MKYEEIMKRREQLASGPIYSIPSDKMKRISEKLADANPKSKDLYEKAKTLIPGGAQHMLVNKNPFPFTIANASGSKMFDVDGNEYVDYLMMAGPIILGHNYPPLIDAVISVIREEGIGAGWTSEWELKSTELIKKHMPSIELFRYFQSGTEANMAASRLVRVYTGKKKIMKMGGSYHGWYDPFIWSMHIPHSGPMDGAGIPSDVFNDLVCCDPPYDLELIEMHLKTGDVAGVFIEPIGGESGATPMPPDFPKELRKLCDTYETLLVFDEVVTAFRVDMGGAQAYYGVDPDITVMGKILTHGFPSSGGIGGKKDIMECLVAGLQPTKGRAFVAGTMGANAITSSAGYWAIKYIEEQNAVEKAGVMGDKLRAGLNELFKIMDFPFFSYNFKSIVHIETAAPVAVDIRKEGAIMSALRRKEVVDDIATALLAEGILTKYGARAFLSIAHTDEDIDKTLKAFEKVLSLLEKE